jgi:uncharacterized protein
MKVSGTSHLSADRDAVWRALNDPAVLVRTIPGCQRLEALGDDAYTMTIAAGVGAITGVYDGEVRLTNQEQPASFRMSARASGAPGTIGAAVLVTLVDGVDGGTELTYDADATVGGMIGGVGQRMLTGVSKKMAAEFFGNVNTALSFPGAPADGRTGVVAATVDGTGRRATQERGWMGGAPTPASPPGSAAGQVFTAPTRPPGGGGNQAFLLGVAVGAAAVLAGALVGGWFAGRRRSRPR